MADTFSDASDNYQLTMHFKGVLGGWSERHCLDAVTPGDAVTLGKLVTDYRLKCLPGFMFLKRSKVSIIGKPRDRKLIRYSYPVAGGYAPEAIARLAPVAGANSPNIDDDCLVIDAETEFGAFNQRFLHGIPDVELANNVLASEVVVPDVAPPLPTAMDFPAGWEDRVGAYLYVLKSRTLFFRETVDHETGATVLLKADYDVLLPTAVTTKKVGRPFGLRRGRAIPR